MEGDAGQDAVQTISHETFDTQSTTVTMITDIGTGMCFQRFMVSINVLRLQPASA